MKKHRVLILSVLLGALILVGAFSLSSVDAGPLFAGGGAPTVVSYQGRVTEGGSPYTGTGYFKFAMVDAAGTTSYWSNDGTSSGGGEPTDGVELTVADGLFHVLLGNTSLTNMTALPASTFEGTERYLRIWFSSDSSSYTQLTPDQRIAAVPYALQAQHAATAGDADTLDGQEAGDFQLSINGNCPRGEMIRKINADGSVVCQPDAPLNRHHQPADNSQFDLDTAGDVGKHTSITIGVDGLPIVSYRDETNGALKVAHCENIFCASASNTIVDNDDDVGQYSSIAIGSDGLPIISYWDKTAGSLKVAHCSQIDCAAAVTTAIDSVGSVDGGQNSIAIGSDGLPVISYYDRDDSVLKVAHCFDESCASSEIAEIDSNGDGDNAMAVGADGLPVISYYKDYDLKVAYCNDLNCHNVIITAIDTGFDIGKYNSIAIGTDGLPIISHYDSSHENLKVTHCSNIRCTSHITTGIDNSGFVGRWTSITIGSDGLPVISYYANETDLKVAHCNDQACQSATAISVDIAGNVGWFTSITIGVDGLPIVSYYDYNDSSLSVTHCSNTFCTPYFRRR